MSKINDNFPFQLLAAADAIATKETQQFSNYNYEFYTFEFVVSGSGTVKYGDEAYECQANSLYILHKKSNHQYYHNPADPWTKIFFNISGALIESLMTAYNFNHLNYIKDVPTLLPYFLEMKSLSYAQNGEASLIFHQLLQSLSTIIQQKSHPYPPEMLELKAVLDQSIKSSFNLQKFSESHQISQTYLINKFKQYWNCTPYEYLLNCKISTAKNLLTYSNLSIKEISAILNFNDQYYFSNIFKLKTTYNPSQFRKKFKQ